MIFPLLMSDTCCRGVQLCIDYGPTCIIVESICNWIEYDPDNLDPIPSCLSIKRFNGITIVSKLAPKESTIFHRAEVHTHSKEIDKMVRIGGIPLPLTLRCRQQYQL